VKLRATAITEAFLTLNNPAKRAQYDKTLLVRTQPPVYNVETVDPFWTLPKLFVLLVIMLVFGGAFYKYNKDQAKLEAECNRNRGTDCGNPEVLRYIESTKIPGLLFARF